VSFEALPEDIDAIGEAPLPRWRHDLAGHAAAEAAILEGYRSGRLHHAWLIGGPPGIGKATFAFRVARFLLAFPDPARAPAGPTLAVPPGHPAAHAVAQLSHPDLALLRRRLDARREKVRTEIAVDDVRDMLGTFTGTAGALGWRVAIVDSAEDLNASSANALLKMLEEPPPRSIFLIVAHAPARILPTIRSRCRKLALEPLAEDEVRRVVAPLAEDAEPAVLDAAIAAAQGSPRRALELIAGGGTSLVGEIERLLDALPGGEIAARHALAEKLARRDGEGDLTLFRETLAAWAAVRVRREVEAGRPLARAVRLAEAAAEAEQRQTEADIYNLDRKAAILATFAALGAAMR